MDTFGDRADRFFVISVNVLTLDPADHQVLDEAEILDVATT